MKYLYLLSVSDAELGDDVCNIEAYSLESLEEQLKKIQPAINKYEAEKQVEEAEELSETYEEHRQDEEVL